MTLTDQTHAIREFGYSEREASFLAAAALHSGYFLTRQFREQRGNMVSILTRKVLAREHATLATYGKRTSLYHLHAKPIYAALGVPDIRHRKDAPDSYRIRTKLMGFDYVLAHPGRRFLPTEVSKLEYFHDELKVPMEVLPTKLYTGERGDRTKRYFLDKFPISIDPTTGQITFAYIASGSFTDISFATWLNQYTPLMMNLGAAEVVYVANSPGLFAKAKREFSAAFPDAAPRFPRSLCGYFEQRLDVESNGLIGRTQDFLDAFRSNKQRYFGSHFERQYASWLTLKDAPLEPQTVRFSTYTIPYSYSWLGNRQS
jgi:hypothetical protein